jgi:acyl-CoA synthetase (AMP-forming)/AMP-acid ligase II/acyl carrier protein
MAAHIPIPRAPQTLMRQLDRHAAEKPTVAAFRFIRGPDFSTDDLTYADLRTRALRVAQSLRVRHAEGNRVLLVLPPGADYIAGFLGCLYAGAIAVPIYPPRRNRPPERFATVARNSGARFAIATADVRRQVETTLAPELVRELDLAWLSPEGEEGASEIWMLPYVDADTPAFLQYTSGSTADPKGVVVTHGSLEHNIALIAEPFGMNASEVLGLSWLPPFHDLGLIGNLLAAVHHGVTEVIMTPQVFLSDPLGWLRAISHFRATSSAAPNFAYDLCVSRAKPEVISTLDLSCWKTAFNGAEPIRAGTLERFASTFAPCGFTAEAMCPGYGLAEATLVVSAQPRGRGALIASFDRAELLQHRAVPSDSTSAVRLVGSGIVLGGQDVRIVDADTRGECSPHGIGEIWVSGPSIARGYWANLEATAETFRARTQPDGAGPFLRTGDLGFLHEGQLFITGRRKDLIIIGGTNHYPQDIELTAQSAHPALAEAMGAAFAVITDEGESLAVVHEINLQHREADFPAVAAALRSRISEEHQLAVTHCALVRFASLPKTSSGKIQRRRARELFLAGQLDAYLTTGAEGALIPVITPMVTDRALPAEEFAKLSEGIARILAITPATLNPGVPLLQQGMSSLRAVELQCLLEEKFSVRLEYEDFFEPWTVNRIAALIAEKRGINPPARRVD